MSCENVSELIKFFGRAEDIFLDALHNGSHGSFLSQCQTACSQLTQALSLGLLPHGAASHCFASIENIRNIALSLINLTDFSQQLGKEAVEEANNLIPPDAHSRTVLHDKQDSLNSQVFRRWFLEHIDDPFPNAETKAELAEETNAVLDKTSKERSPKHNPRSSEKPTTKEQCQLWFINTRRRSNWTEFFREFAFSSKPRMTQLIQILKNEEQNPEGSQHALSIFLSEGEQGRKKAFQAEKLKKRVVRCREAYYSMLEWLEQSPREKASDWLSRVINEAKSEFKENRRQKKEQRRKILEFEALKVKELESSYDDDNSSALPITNNKSRPGRKRKIQDEDELPRRMENGRKLRKIARLPSRTEEMHSSTSEGHRTASGSSSSSFFTNSSFDSSSSADQPAPIESSPLSGYGGIQHSLSLSGLQDIQALFSST